MGFTVYNEQETYEHPVDSQRFPLAQLDKVDLAILAAGMAGVGVLSGCAVTGGALDMTVSIAAGVVLSNGVERTVTAGDVTFDAAHATLERFDLVVIAADGTKTIRKGTASAIPVFPTPTDGDVVLAAAHIFEGTTSVGDGSMCDKRVMLRDTNRPGDMRVQARGTVPAGWLLCDGGEVSRTDYAALYAAIGTAFGAGNGTTTFNVPDMRGKYVYGDDATTAVGDTLGSITHEHDLAGLHDHGGATVAGGDHDHGGATGQPPTNNTRASGTLAMPTQSHTHSISASGTHTHTIGDELNHTHGSKNHLPPSVVAVWVIKT